MRRRPSAISHDAATARFAWWASFFATLTLVAILCLTKSAQAQTVPVTGWPAPAAPALFAEEESEDEAETSEDEELEIEECEDGEDGEEEECEEEDTAIEAPQECLLTSVRATVLATVNRDRLRLQVSYTTTSPTPVAVDYGLHGSKGSLYLGSEKKQFARQGVLRLSKSLTETQMEKVMAAKGFTVRLRVAAAPRYCQSLFDRQLNVRRATPSGLSWQQSE